ncbi:MAG: transcriptional repressor LexA [Candidatus Omnitrophota bacterium]
MEELTEKQKKILNFIQDKIRLEGIPPTIREIGIHFKFSSTGTVRDYLKILSKKGYLKIAPRKSRSIELFRRLGYRIPILAQVKAGEPNLAYENLEGYLDLNDFCYRKDREVFVLKVKGDSMTGAGILEGDLILVRKQRMAKTGEIIVALLENNEATVKRLKSKAGRVYLESENANYPPIYKEFNIIGKVIATIRKYN